MGILVIFTTVNTGMTGTWDDMGAIRQAASPTFLSISSKKAHTNSWIPRCQPLGSEVDLSHIRLTNHFVRGYRIFFYSLNKTYRTVS